MTIEFAPPELSEYNIAPKDMKSGHAYEEPDGTIYLCNIHGSTVAVSFCGNYHIRRGDLGKYYREVDLKIQIIRK